MGSLRCVPSSEAQRSPRVAEERGLRSIDHLVDAKLREGLSLVLEGPPSGVEERGVIFS